MTEAVRGEYTLPTATLFSRRSKAVIAADVLQACPRLIRSEVQFKDGVAALRASRKKPGRAAFRRQKRMRRAPVRCACNKKWPRDQDERVRGATGMNYSGPIVGNDERFQYQQVAPHTLMRMTPIKRSMRTNRDGAWCRS